MAPEPAIDSLRLVARTLSDLGANNRQPSRLFCRFLRKYRILGAAPPTAVHPDQLNLLGRFVGFDLGL